VRPPSLDAAATPSLRYWGEEARASSASMARRLWNWL